MSASPVVLEDLLTGLASTPSDVRAVQQLIKGQYGKRTLQFRKIADRCAAQPGSDQKQLSEWYSLAVAVQRKDPQVFHSLLLDPDIANWLAGPDFDSRSVGRIAAAGAILARLPATVVVPVENGEVFLPGLGTALVGPEQERAVVHVTADRVTLTAGHVQFDLPSSQVVPENWLPVRRLTVGQKAPLTVRFAAEGPVSKVLRALYPRDHVKAQSEEDWKRALADAWQILENGHPVHAVSIAAGLRAIVPVPPAEEGNAVSGTMAGAFGAIALSLPSHPEHFAVTLVHEFQHAKLSALLDLIQLYEPDDRAVYYAPWRPDPRPLGALLQGIYAHLGVAQFWGTQRSLTDSSRALGAHVEFVRWRDDTWQACKGIADAPSLTRAGDLFVRKLRGELDQLRAESVPPEAARFADLIALDHKVAWRLRNLEPDPQAVSRLAEAWMSNSPATLSSDFIRRRDTPEAVHGRRIQVLYRYLSGDSQDIRAGSSAAEALYAEGDYSGALRAYERKIAKTPADLDAWAGLTLSATAGGMSLDALAAMPEVAAAIYQRAASAGPAPKRPLSLAHWLDGARMDSAAGPERP